VNKQFNCQKKPKCDFGKLLQEHVNANRNKRDAFTNEEQKDYREELKVFK
jgi:hypothetical protein